MLESGIKWFGAKIEQSNDMYFHELPVSTSLSFIAKDDTGLISVSEFASIISTIVPGTGLSGTGLSEMRDVTLNVDASIPEITTLAGLTSFGSAGATTNILAGDIDWYNPVTNGNPILKMGVDASESLQIKAFYQSGTQSMQLAQFITKTESTTADDGRFTFHPDEVKVLSIDDGGIDFEANMGISIDGTDILTDSSGTATLSNIDALDATTIATFETAMEANLDTFGSQMTSASSLASVGTITSGAWQGDVIASAYLDADTAHLSGVQSFTGAKSFSEINKAKFGGNKTVIPGDGAVIHVDAHTVTDGATSGSGTAALYTHVNIEAPALLATQESVTTTAAASLYIKDAPSASTNQTITNAYALWVDAGLVKFDGDLTVGGTITGDVTGAATTAGTVTTAAQPAIESIGTDGDTLSILSDTLLMSNTTNSAPTIKLVNTTDDNEASQIIFEKLRDDDGVASGQNLGEIWFRGQNSAQESEDYAYIVGEIDVSNNAQESGQLKLGLANHDGGNGNGLILTGGSENNEIDVTLGLGTSSVTTVAGTLTMGSTAALTNAGLVAVANQSSITGLGTISSGVWNGTAIAHAYIGNDAIDGDNLADDAVNSEHYTDGSIDTAHIADDQVTFAKASGVTPNVYGSIIKLLPSDFAANIDGGNTKLGVGYTDTAGSAYGMKVGSANTELFAFVSIPEGMTATHVDVFDKDNRALEVFEVQINATSLTSKGSGNCNTTLDITDVDATATNFLAIKITTTATTDKVFGGQVTIAAQ